MGISAQVQADRTDLDAWHL